MSPKEASAVRKSADRFRRISLTLVFGIPATALFLGSSATVKSAATQPSLSPVSGLTSIFASVPGVRLHATVNFNGSGIRRSSKGFEPPQEQILVSARGLAPGKSIRLVVRLEGDARFQRPQPEFVSSGTKLVTGALPADLVPMSPDELLEISPSRSSADLYIIPATANTSGVASGYVFGTLSRSFQAFTKTNGLINLPSYGNKFTPDDREINNLPLDLGPLGPWYLGKPLTIDVNYDETIPQFARIDTSDPPLAAPPLLEWQGESLIAPHVYYTLVPAEQSNNTHLFYSGVFLGLAGACAIAALQALFERQ
jgi:hypothetical protein